MRWRPIVLAGLAVIALDLVAHAESGRFRARAKRHDYKGIERRGGSGAAAERQRLLDQARALRDRSNQLSARAEALEERGRSAEANDLEERADSMWMKAREVEQKANQLRYGSRPQRRGSARFDPVE
jgi:hypothetical protein